MAKKSLPKSILPKGFLREWLKVPDVMGEFWDETVNPKFREQANRLMAKKCGGGKKR
jgi:hypothetical protein